MASFCLNFFIFISIFAVFFFSILSIMIIFNSEALEVDDKNKLNKTFKVLVAGMVIIYFISLDLRCTFSCTFNFKKKTK